MALPTEIIPTGQNRVMDLVGAAGVDVSDWPNYKRGAENPAANPKYCYEWGFVEPGKLVVLNLWLEHMVEVDGVIEQLLNYRDAAARAEKNTLRRMRRMRMERALATASFERLPIRVIVLDRSSRKDVGANGRPTGASARHLDPTPWAIASLDAVTGEVVVRRGAMPQTYVDQFSLAPPPDGAAQRKEGMASSRSRDPEVRRFVLARAGGRCELCGLPGFALSDGRLYLETHHVVPLSEEGPDGVGNVVAICPNDHRRAHHGRDASEIRKKLQAHLASWSHGVGAPETFPSAAT